MTPFLIYLVIRMGGNEIIYGVIGATYSFFQLIGAPLLGRYSDIYGRKKILFISQLGTLLSWVIVFIALVLPVEELMKVDSPLLGSFMVTTPLLVLFLGRAFDGLTGGNISVANAYLVDVSKKDELQKNFGKMAASTNMGFIVGPLLAGVLGASVYGEKLPVAVATIISAVALAMIFFLPDSHASKINEAPCKNPNRRILGKEIKDCFDQKKGFKSVLRVQGVSAMLFLYFLIFLGFNTFYTAFPAHSAGELGWSVAELGVFFSVLSVSMILVQGPVMSRISGKFEPASLVIWGSFLMALSFATFSISGYWITYLAAMLFAVGNGIMWPSFMTILGKMGSKNQQGLIQGVSTSAGAMASIFGLIAGGLLYSRLGAQTFLIGGAVFVFVFIYSLVSLRRIAAKPLS